MNIECPAANRHRVFTAGTLRYTRFSLSMLFFWLLWGYFTYLLMEIALPSLLPLLLRQYKASNIEISFITTSLNVIGNTLVNPVVSFVSDRHRGPLGRRRPFIIYSTPFIVLFLGLVPFASEIATSLAHVSGVQQVLAFSPVVPGILFIGIFVMGFQIFDVFVGAVYHYLVRDTVPEEFLGRFGGMFRLVGGFAPLVFNLLIFRQAENHMKEVFVGVAIFYGLAMLLMCWKVKEGEYPPPELLGEAEKLSWFGRLWGNVGLYVKDCLRDPLYLYSFLGTGFAAWANLATVFGVLFYKEELGMSLAVQGNINAVNNVISVVIALPIGYLIDRYNYFRHCQLGALFMGLLSLLGFFFIHDVATLLAYGIGFSVPRMFFSMGIARSAIAVYPKEKYGQFGSAANAFASLVAIGLSLLAAKFVDLCGNYRSFLLWHGFFMVLTGMIFVMVEQRWLKLGGWKHYKAP